MANINGTNGDDVLTGTEDDDLIRGRAGDDFINAGSGNDEVRGGQGDDVIFGEEGDDDLRGGRGSDEISGGNGDDTISGGRGNDLLFGGTGADIINGGRNADTLDGGAGNDVVNGGRGADTAIYVVSENVGSLDSYSGGNGDDTLRLVVDYTEIFDAGIQTDILAYNAFLLGNPSNNDVFNFTSFDLSASGFEALEIEVINMPADSPLIVGNFSDGVMNIGGGVTNSGDTLIPPGAVLGDTVTVASAVVGNLDGSDGNLVVSGTTAELLINSGNFTIGNEGIGSVRIEAGATVIVDSGNQDINMPGDFVDVLVGASITSIGDLTVSGIGSSLTTIGTDNIIRVGYNGGQGALLVEDGGNIETLFFEVARNAGSTGVATITGAGSEVIVSSEFGRFSPPFDFESGFARVGRNGADGELNILNGGRLEIREGLVNNTDTTAPGFQIGRDGATGRVVVDGSDSEISIIQNNPNAGFGGPFLEVGREIGGDGILFVKNGGEINLNGDNANIGIGVGDASSSGKVEITEGASINASSNTNAAFRVGAGGSGELLIDGLLSQVTLNGDDASLFVGAVANSQGKVEITNGGTIDLTGGSLTALRVGAGGTGDLLLDGPQSQINLTGDNTIFHVGSVEGSDGTVEITDGGSITLSSENSVAFRVGADGIGELLIDGPQSRIDVLGGEGFSRFAVGIFSDGSATLTNGATVYVESLDDNFSSLVVGDRGNGELNILSGSQVIIDGMGNQVFASFGTNAIGSANVLVSGAGSLLAVGGLNQDVNSSINLSAQEFQGPATLTLENGGEARAFSVLVGDNGFLHGETGKLSVISTPTPGASTDLRLEGGHIGKAGTIGTFEVDGGIRIQDYFPTPELDPFSIHVDIGVSSPNFLYH